MLPASRPAACRQRLNELIRGLRPDRDLGHACRQARRMLDPHILDVDPGLARRLEEPGELAWPVADHHLDDGVSGSGPASLARASGTPASPPPQQPGQALNRPPAASAVPAMRAPPRAQSAPPPP